MQCPVFTHRLVLDEILFMKYRNKEPYFNVIANLINGIHAKTLT
jgi:hypothetical protein